MEFIIIRVPDSIIATVWVVVMTGRRWRWWTFSWPSGLSQHHARGYWNLAILLDELREMLGSEEEEISSLKHVASSHAMSQFIRSRLSMQKKHAQR